MEPNTGNVRPDCLVPVEAKNYNMFFVSRGDMTAHRGHII